MKSKKITLFLVGLLISINLVYNRFYTNLFIKENPLYSHWLINYLEHFIWGFIPPITFVIFCLGFYFFFCKKVELSKRFIFYWIWIGIYLIITFSYYTVGTFYCYYLKEIILEIIGLILAYVFIQSQKEEYQIKLKTLS